MFYPIIVATGEMDSKIPRMKTMINSSLLPPTRQSVHYSENSLKEAVNTVPKVQLQRRFSLKVSLRTNGKTYLSAPTYKSTAPSVSFM